MAPYYALTLKIWRENVEARPAEVRARGFDGSFLRKWRYYLCYCEAAFMEDNIDVLQYTLQKPHAAA